MGVSKYDKQAGDRKMSERYALDSAEGVRKLLSEYHALKGRQFLGDYDAVILLTDLRTAIELAKLTKRQSEALRLIYEEDLTQADVAKELGVTQAAVSYCIESAIEEVAEVYYYWSGHGEGYDITTKEEAQDERINLQGAI